MRGGVTYGLESVLHGHLEISGRDALQEVGADRGNVEGRTLGKSLQTKGRRYGTSVPVCTWTQVKFKYQSQRTCTLKGIETNGSGLIVKTQGQETTWKQQAIGNIHTL